MHISIKILQIKESIKMVLDQKIGHQRQDKVDSQRKWNWRRFSQNWCYIVIATHTLQSFHRLVLWFCFVCTWHVILFISPALVSHLMPSTSFCSFQPWGQQYHHHHPVSISVRLKLSMCSLSFFLMFQGFDTWTTWFCPRHLINGILPPPDSYTSYC